MGAEEFLFISAHLPNNNAGSGSTDQIGYNSLALWARLWTKLAQDIALTLGDVGYTLAYDFMDRAYTVDRVFASTDKICAKYFTVVNNKTGGKYPSDHLPLFMQIEVFWFG